MIKSMILIFIWEFEEVDSKKKSWIGFFSLFKYGSNVMFACFQSLDTCLCLKWLFMILNFLPKSILHVYVLN